jgi:uncharacterized iron-regulated membrane protein
MTAHIWLGLIVGVYFTLIGISGSVLVFHTELDNAMVSSLSLIAKPLGLLPRSLDFQAKAVLEHYPGMSIEKIRLPHSSSDATLFVLSSLGKNKADRDVFVNPYNAKIIGDRVSGGVFFPFVHSLHCDLLLNEQGSKVNGVCALISVLLLATGIWIWMPKPHGFWHAAHTKITLRRGASFRRFLLDLHNAVGFYAGLLLLVITLTGAGLIFRDQTVLIVSILTGTSRKGYHYQPHTGLRVTRKSPPVSFDTMLKIGHTALLNEQIVEVSRGQGANRSWCIVKGRKDDHEIRPLLTKLMLDPSGTRIVAIKKGNSGSLAPRIMAWLGPIHVGRFGPGMLYYPVKALYFLSGLAPGTLFVTGMLMYVKKLQFRNKTQPAYRAGTGWYA